MHIVARPQIEHTTHGDMKPEKKHVRSVCDLNVTI